jgi:CSLREA domain-containing protein
VRAMSDRRLTLLPHKRSVAARLSLGRLGSQRGISMRSRIGFSGRMSVTTRRAICSFVLAASAMLAVLAPTRPVHAATTIMVTTTVDELANNGKCSLREAIQAANRDIRVDACAAGSGADTIILPAGTYRLSVEGWFEDAGLTGDLDITASLTLKGAGASSTTIDGGGRVAGFLVHGVLQVFGTATVVTISGVTIQNGYLGTELGDRTSGGLSNGAIDRLGGTMTVIDSVIRNNAGTYGGVENHGTMTLLNSSVTGNAGRFSGGGVWNEGTMTVTNSSINSNGNSAGVGGGVVNRSRLTITNSTISGNHASSGGGIYNQGSLIVHSSTFSDNVGGALVGDATLDNTILANSRPFELGPQPDCSGTLTSNGYNLIGLATGCTLVGNTTGDVLGTDPKLGPLQNNGGPTFTHALLPGSPAIDAGNPTAPGKSPSACLATDQRGVARPQDGNLDGRAVCDIGAFEVQPPVTFASLCTLSRQLVTNAALSNGMCSTLQAAERSKARGLPGVKAKLLSTYADLVDTAQRIGTVTTERAARLKSLAATL